MWRTFFCKNKYFELTIDAAETCIVNMLYARRKREINAFNRIRW